MLGKRPSGYLSASKNEQGLIQVRKQKGTEPMKQWKILMVIATAAASLTGIALAQSNAPAAPAPKTWVDTLSFKGDLRYRFETIEDMAKKDANGDEYTRYRNRIRARLGADAKLSDQLKAGLELSTGGADPVSGNQTLGGGFDKEEFRLNQAYADYSFFGDNPNELHVVGGKMKTPFLTTPDDLVLDVDTNPEGLAAKGQYTAGIATLFANAGYLWVEERADTQDLMLYAGQAATKLQFVPEVGLTLGATYYGFQNMEGYDVVDWEKKNNAYGNSTQDGTVSAGTTNKAWKMEYTPVVYFAQLDLWLVGKPLAFYGQQLTNLDADDFDQGQQYGVSLGKAKNLKTWELGYSYARLEKDATVGFLTDSDRWGGGTDGQGHKVYGKYQLLKNAQVSATYFFANEKKISDVAKTTDYDRLQIDLSVNF
jgi:hypothetical protein